MFFPNNWSCKKTVFYPCLVHFKDRLRKRFKKYGSLYLCLRRESNPGQQRHKQAVYHDATTVNQSTNIVKIKWVCIEQR